MSLRHLRPLTLLVAVAGLAAAAPPASALTQTDYAVTIEGSATYARTDVGPGAYGDWVQRNAAELSWKSEIPSVTFYDDQVSTTSVPKLTAAVKSASTDVSIPTPEGPVTGACSGTSWEEPPTPGIIAGETEKPPGATAEGIFLTVLSGGTIKLSSCSGAMAPGPYGLPVDGTGTAPIPPYQQFFEMPHEAIGMGKIIQLLEKHAGGVNCPGWYEKTDSCSLTWKAKVTFLRTFQAEVGEPEIHPEPPVQRPAPGDDELPPPLDPTDVPLPPLDPTEDDDELFIPLPGGAKLSASASSASARVVCPTGCRGTAVATALRGARARAAAAPKVLARARFVAQAGRPATVRLRFGARARRAIRRAGGVRLQLTATPNGGRAVRRTLSLRVGGQVA